MARDLHALDHTDETLWAIPLDVRDMHDIVTALADRPQNADLKDRLAGYYRLALRRVTAAEALRAGQADG